jgi:hypothetical protein
MWKAAVAGGREGENGVNGGSSALPFGEGEMKLSLRTKGLRENAAQ